MTYRRGGACYIAESEKERLESLFERYDLHESSDTGEEGKIEPPVQPEDNLPLLE